jgi:hemoglobin-like flavoprotein
MGEISMDIALLKYSFGLLSPQKEAFAHSFYQRLFLCYPQVQPLFAKVDMKRQESSLVATLEMIIDGMERGDNLAPALQALGRRHVDYGAKAADYPLVGAVLLETLREYLGHGFTIEILKAWSQAYELISRQMQHTDPDLT